MSSAPAVLNLLARRARPCHSVCTEIQHRPCFSLPSKRFASYSVCRGRPARPVTRPEQRRGRAAEGGHDRTRRDEWSRARDGEHADAASQPESPAENAPGRGASGRSFRSLRVMLVREVARARLVGEEHRDVVVWRSLQPEIITMRSPG